MDQLSNDVQEGFVNSWMKHPQVEFAAWITPLVKMQKAGHDISTLLMEMMGELTTKRIQTEFFLLMFLATYKAGNTFDLQGLR